MKVKKKNLWDFLLKKNERKLNKMLEELKKC